MGIIYAFAMCLYTTSKVIAAAEHNERPHTVIQGNYGWDTIIGCIDSNDCYKSPGERSAATDLEGSKDSQPVSVESFFTSCQVGTISKEQQHS